MTRMDSSTLATPADSARPALPSCSGTVRPRPRNWSSVMPLTCAGSRCRTWVLLVVSADVDRGGGHRDGGLAFGGLEGQVTRGRDRQVLLGLDGDRAVGGVEGDRAARLVRDHELPGRRGVVEGDRVPGPALDDAP